MSENLIERNGLALRLMCDEQPDYEFMARWLTDPRVLDFYEGRDNPYPIERIIEKYSPRLLGAEDVTACFIVRAGVPIGYIQYYPHDDEDRAEYGIAPDALAFGMDTFIGEPELWGQGLGTQSVILARDYLFDTLHADILTLDPETWNTRAIRCYEKCGFRKTQLLKEHEMHEGEMKDSWLMVLSKPAIE